MPMDFRARVRTVLPPLVVDREPEIVSPPAITSR